jgi:hypothetical protein
MPRLIYAFTGKVKDLVNDIDAVMDYEERVEAGEDMDSECNPV